VKKAMRYVSTNERGLRIGQDHPNAKLTDLEVAALIRDRGPDEAPWMSYSRLAKKYGISKSGVRFLIIGGRRGQPIRYVKRNEPVSYFSDKKVYAQFRVKLRTRAIFNRLGGCKVLEKIAAIIDENLKRAHNESADEVFRRFLAKLTL